MNGTASFSILCSGTRRVICQMTTKTALCDREELIGFVDAYLDALGKNDPSQAPFAGQAKFTENGQLLRLGTGLWATATPTNITKPHFIDAAEPEAGQVLYFGLVHEAGRPIILSLRLRVENGLIAEAETIVCRDPEQSGQPRVFNPSGMIKPRAIFSEIVPPAERCPRDEMIGICNRYFDGIIASDGSIMRARDECLRIENGAQTVLNPRALTEAGKLGVVAQVNTGRFRDIEAARDRRYFLVDEERGVVAMSFLFDHPGPVTGAAFESRYDRPNSMLITELFQIRQRELYQIEAVLNVFPYGMKSGWD